ncbi:hypothetical protein CI15_01505 [Paraburkholderia monticola]|uniref:Uncharacterized protein n=1 Tax=Paraburkholderia monticola TaxID=1399968 RepID=A0A149Q1V8_9BURK|nr:hypothetical protein CI15_01505 [Paraburkholderia monticola]
MVRQEWASARPAGVICVRIPKDRVIEIEYFAPGWVIRFTLARICTFIVLFLADQVHAACVRRIAPTRPDSHPGARLHRVDAIGTTLAHFLLT